MQKDSVVVYCRRFSMGGTETLILRLLKYYKQQGFRTILLTQERVENANISKDLSDVDTEHYVYCNDRNQFLSDGAPLVFESTDRPLVISQFLPEFLKCFRLLTRSVYGVQFNHILYIVHPHSTFFFSRKLRVLGRKFMLTLLQQNMLVFMDETCIQSFCEYYSLEKTKHTFKIFRLPMFIEEGQLHTIRNRPAMEILTISRFEFPFKGYVLGLIQSVERLLTEGLNLKLTVIGNGDGKGEVDALITGMSEKVRSQIVISGEMPYKQILGKIEKCDIYVGMGTTVLDAANRNKIVITAAMYQRSDHAIGLFADNYETIGGFYSPDIEHPTFYSLIKEIYFKDDSEFFSLSIASKNVLRKHYDIYDIGKGLYDFANKNLRAKVRRFIGTICWLFFVKTSIIK